MLSEGLSIERKTNPENVTFSRHNSLIPSMFAWIDKEQLSSCQTLSIHALSGLIDKEQLAVTGSKHEQCMPGLCKLENSGGILSRQLRCLS